VKNVYIFLLNSGPTFFTVVSGPTPRRICKVPKYVTVLVKSVTYFGTLQIHRGVGPLTTVKNCVNVVMNYQYTWKICTVQFINSILLI
jgi:hypothetical protein